MKRLSRLAACLLVSVSLSSAAVTPAFADDSMPSLSVAEAGARLTEAHRILLSGISNLQAARKEVIAGDVLTTAVLRRYHQRFWQQLAVVVALERELSSIEGLEDESQRADHSDRVGQAHLATLRLQAELDGRTSPGGATGPGCLGSISGNVQGPGGPVVGSLVQAFVAAGASVGFDLTDSNGDYQIDDLPIGDYYVVTSNADGLIDEVWDNVVCAGGSCDPTTGSAVTVSSGTTTTGVNFILAAGGRIGGALTGLPGPIPLFFTTVNIFNPAGGLVTSTTSDIAGMYLTETGLPDGSYRAVTTNLFGYLDELYNNIPCAAGVACDPVSGTPIAVTAPNTTSGINFALDTGGGIAGNITDSATSLPIENILVGIHGTTGALITFGATDGAGDYMSLAGLPTGDFFAVTGNLEGYVDELYDNIPCTGGLCTVTSGTMIPVTLGATTPDRDFALTTGGTFSGTVTKVSDGSPIVDVFILGYTATGGLVGTATTNPTGQYTLTSGLGTGSYRATTLNPYGFDDELFDNLPCPFSVCDVTVGTPIGVTIGVDTPNIDFDLAGDSIASCGFEGCSTCDLVVVP